MLQSDIISTTALDNVVHPKITIVNETVKELAVKKNVRSRRTDTKWEVRTTVDKSRTFDG